MKKLFLTFASATCLLAASSLYSKQTKVESVMCNVGSTCTSVVQNYISQWKNFVVDANFKLINLHQGEAYNCLITSAKDQVSVSSIQSSKGVLITFKNPSKAAELGSEATVHIKVEKLSSAKRTASVTFRFHRSVIGLESSISMLCQTDESDTDPQDLNEGWVIQ